VHSCANSCAQRRTCGVGRAVDDCSARCFAKASRNQTNTNQTAVRRLLALAYEVPNQSAYAMRCARDSSHMGAGQGGSQSPGADVRGGEPLKSVPAQMWAGKSVIKVRVRCEQMCAHIAQQQRCNERCACPSPAARLEETLKLDLRGVRVLRRHVRQQRLLGGGAGGCDPLELPARTAMDANGGAAVRGMYGSRGEGRACLCLCGLTSATH
jgi:hypothetical protein